jgi:hypothetical protein
MSVCVPPPKKDMAPIHKDKVLKVCAESRGKVPGTVTLSDEDTVYKCSSCISSKYGGPPTRSHANLE